MAGTKPGRLREMVKEHPRAGAYLFAAGRSRSKTSSCGAVYAIVLAVLIRIIPAGTIEAWRAERSTDLSERSPSAIHGLLFLAPPTSVAAGHQPQLHSTGVDFMYQKASWLIAVDVAGLENFVWRRPHHAGMPFLKP